MVPLASLHACFPQLPQEIRGQMRRTSFSSFWDVTITGTSNLPLSALCRPLQVFDLHSGPKPVVFVLHSFLSAKLTRMGLLT